ncbi:unnamed protein product [Gongylonema pulchrum]|uniref:Transcriptional regulator n=1 Tax=Gongylonema pulchrum TaxID=637853 RepID=A0A183D9V8_9BILA|nr:unnamed protein product [Gongylonema pulchrum]
MIAKSAFENQKRPVFVFSAVRFVGSDLSVSTALYKQKTTTGKSADDLLFLRMAGEQVVSSVRLASISKLMLQTREAQLK